MAALRPIDFNTRVRISAAHEELLRHTVERLMRATVRDLRRLASGLGMTAALAAELHRTARIRSDFFDTTLDPHLRCFAQVLASLEEIRTAAHSSQGHVQAARMIHRVENAILTGSDLEPMLTALEHDEPAKIALELMDSVVRELLDSAKHAQAVAQSASGAGEDRFEDRIAQAARIRGPRAPHQENQHEQAETDRERDSKTS